jgi:hypothetical protein
MVGAAVKGLSKLLRKGTKAKRPRGTPTKAAMMARRSMLRGATPAEKLKKTRGDPQKALRKQKKPLIGKFEKGIATGAAATLAYQELKKGQKKAKAEKDKKLKKAIAQKKEEDKKKKDAYGKRAPKKKVNYGGK